MPQAIETMPTGFGIGVNAYDDTNECKALMDVNRYDPDLARKMMQRFAGTLERVVSALDLPLSQLRLDG